MNSVFELIGRTVYSKEKSKVTERLIYSAGLKVPVDAFLGYLFLVTVLAGLGATFESISNQGLFLAWRSFVSGFIPQPPDVLVYLVAAAVCFGISFWFIKLIAEATLSLRKDQRTHELEVLLPDFLLLVSANVKAGMTLDQSLWYAAKPEFGSLAKEVRGTIQQSFSGQNLDDALDELGTRFDSKIFTRTMSLLKQAIATGGEVTSVLERTSSDVRESVVLKREVAANLVLYEIFILFAAGAGAPFLLAVAGKLIEVFEKQKANFPAATASGGSFFGQFGGISGGAEIIIKSSEFFVFSLVTIAMTCLFSSFIVGVIKKGTKNEGIKYFPFLLLLGYAIFFLVSQALTSSLSSLGG